MLWQQYGLVAAGLFESQADIDSWPKQTFGDVKPGDIKYIDINGDGKIDSNDESLSDGLAYRKLSMVSDYQLYGKG